MCASDTNVKIIANTVLSYCGTIVQMNKLMTHQRQACKAYKDADLI